MLASLNQIFPVSQQENHLRISLTLPLGRKRDEKEISYDRVRDYRCSIALVRDFDLS